MTEEKKQELIKEHWGLARITDKEFRRNQAFRACAARDSFYFKQEETRGQDYRVGFLSGVEWADKHPSKETVHRIVEKVYEWFLEDSSRVMLPRLNECVDYVLMSNGV